MNNELQRRLVATHNQVDRELAISAAFELVRAIQDRDIESLRNKYHFAADNFTFGTYSEWELWAIQHLADLITIPGADHDNV